MSASSSRPRNASDRDDVPRRAPGAFNPLPSSQSAGGISVAGLRKPAHSAGALSGLDTSRRTVGTRSSEEGSPVTPVEQIQGPGKEGAYPFEPQSSGQSVYKGRRQQDASPVRNDYDSISSSVASGTSFGDSRYPASSSSSIYNGQTSANSTRPSAQALAGAFGQRGSSPLRRQAAVSAGIGAYHHQRKHANSQGLFEPSLPSTSHLRETHSDIPASLSHTNQLLQGQMAQGQAGLSASQIAAQAAYGGNHQRKRSQTLPQDNVHPQRKSSRGPTSPPLLSLTEASGERQPSFSAVSGGNGQQAQSYKNSTHLLGLGGSVNPAATAASVVFARSPQGSPGLSDHSAETASIRPPPRQQQVFTPPLPTPQPEPPSKGKEKSKVKLFSRPHKLKDLGKDKAEKEKLGSPSKLGFSTQNVMGRAGMNASSTSLLESASSSASMYSMANSSQATIRAIDMPQSTGEIGKIEKEGKEKKHHHFLSRQKQKLHGEHHLPLSSSKSNSQPVDPSAPSSFYNFNVPSSPGPGSSFGKSMSGLDLRHGGRALREKKREEKKMASEYGYGEEVYRQSEDSIGWNGPGSLGKEPIINPATVYGAEAIDGGRYGLHGMSADDAWPLLKTKLLVVFQGDDVKFTIEDFNRLVTTHVQKCVRLRAPHVIIDDLLDLLRTGFMMIDATLRRTDNDRLIPHLVDQWTFVFTTVLPFLEGVFLPLDLEFEGQGVVMTSIQAKDFWGALPVSSVSPGADEKIPAGKLLSVRRFILSSYRDIIILPRFDLLQTLFSRLSLDAINKPPTPQFTPSPGLTSNLSSSFPDRPSTAMSLDPAHSSYSSQQSTLLNGGGSGPESVGMRSRGVSNVSFGSDQRDAVYMGLQPNKSATSTRPITPNVGAGGVPGSFGSGSGGPGSFMHGIGGGTPNVQREANAKDGTAVTETVGRMLQCMSVLTAVGVIPGDGKVKSPTPSIDEEKEKNGKGKDKDGGESGRRRAYSTGMVEDERKQEMMEGLTRALKLNWLGRGRTGRNRRGLVGAKMKPMGIAA